MSPTAIFALIQFYLPAVVLTGLMGVRPQVSRPFPAWLHALLAVPAAIIAVGAYLFVSTANDPVAGAGFYLCITVVTLGLLPICVVGCVYLLTSLMFRTVAAKLNSSTVSTPPQRRIRPPMRTVH